MTRVKTSPGRVFVFCNWTSIQRSASTNQLPTSKLARRASDARYFISSTSPSCPARGKSATGQPWRFDQPLYFWVSWLAVAPIHDSYVHALFSSRFRRRVSMATASALEGLPPMQRADSMAKKMTKMFKKPDAHAAFLTSSRFALDLIKVRGATKTRGMLKDIPSQYHAIGRSTASCRAKAKV